MNLCAEEGKLLMVKIIELANEGLTVELELGDSAVWGVRPAKVKSPEELLYVIDRGNHPGGRDEGEFLERLPFFLVCFSHSVVNRNVDYRSC